ncbi:hypothetical protein BH23THE1_BH23THE1_15430 [soil metagenome]
MAPIGNSIEFVTSQQLNNLIGSKSDSHSLVIGKTTGKPGELLWLKSQIFQNKVICSCYCYHLFHSDFQISLFHQVLSRLFASLSEEVLEVEHYPTVGNIQSPITSSSSSASTSSNSSNIDTVGILMVPTQDIDDHIAQITDAGITVDNTYDFQDLRGGQEGTGDTQTLIVWTTGGKDLGETLSSLSELSADLPYS